MLEYSFFQLSDTAKERKVPSSRFSRVANFGGEWNLNASLICRIFETGLEESVYKYLHVVWLFTSLTLHSFVGLFVGLGVGALSEVTKRGLGLKKKSGKNEMIKIN